MVFHCHFIFPMLLFLNSVVYALLFGGNAAVVNALLFGGHAAVLESCC